MSSKQNTLNYLPFRYFCQLSAPNHISVKKYIFVIALITSLSLSAQPNSALRQRLGKEGNAPENKSNLTQDKVANNKDAMPAETATGTASGDSAAARASSLYKINSDSSIKIGLLLPFDYAVSSGKIYGYMNDKELTKGDIYKLKESSREGMDFYEGLQYSLAHTHSKQKIEFLTFDTENNDSVVQELLKLDALKRCDLIIGPTNTSEAKLVAAFCKRNHIINIQPFVASKSISYDNPYLVRLVPTIDAHLQKEYEMVMDSFSDKNIIVYTTKHEHDLSAAKQLDTLFRSYNAMNTGSSKLKYTFVNTGDSSLPAARRSLNYHLLPKEQNIVLMTCYEEPMVNSMLRTAKENMVIFGMPTWIDAEQIRADYLSNAQPYFTDNFYADTSKAIVNDFIKDYTDTYNQRPSRYSYMGYDAMNYLSLIFDRYGKNVTDGVNKESFEGLGYSFHISPMIHTARGGTEPVVNYYANTAMHLFQVRDYRVWLVK
jgi:ABC-type branched-subunit amino acid transport system substrate-binding protein